MGLRDWLGLRHELPHRRRLVLVILSFVLPLALWAVVSYVPWIWHPQVHVTDPGGVDYFMTGMDVDRAVFAKEAINAQKAGLKPPQGYRVNPVYFPPPHAVAKAFYTAFVTPPRLPTEPWLHESLGHSIRTIFWGFVISSIFGVPLGILCGTYRFFAKLQEPFIEFFRYLPAPSFGALCVAILGIDDPPKIAIIFIGTFFQQVLVIGNTVRKVDPALVEAAETLGARGWRLLTGVVIPAAITDIYTDMRILLGWAWTYLIVAELVGTMSGITYFITQQARYRHFENVYAAMAMIGIIGVSTDMTLAWLATVIFPWKRRTRKTVRSPRPKVASAAPAVSADASGEGVRSSTSTVPPANLVGKPPGPITSEA
jgi:NitT/TauT family transport system permease protein